MSERELAGKRMGTLAALTLAAGVVTGDPSVMKARSLSALAPILNYLVPVASAAYHFGEQIGRRCFRTKKGIYRIESE